MTNLPFIKGHGLGNDFVVVSETDLPKALTTSQVRLICDRRQGLGADGVLVFRKGTEPYMQILNSDGSEPEMCGNGLRVFARYLVEEQGFPRDGVVMTLAGPRAYRLLADQSVEVEMGQAEFLSEADGLSVDVEEWPAMQGSHISMGNPHFVVFGRESMMAQHELARLGVKVQDHPAFPEGVNLSSAFLKEDASIDLRVFERGCGLTQACGTAACAVAAAAVETKRIPSGQPVRVHLPGGALQIQVSANRAVRMTGAADLVARGTISAELLGSA